MRIKTIIFVIFSLILQYCPLGDSVEFGRIKGKIEYADGVPVCGVYVWAMGV